jgi:ABC-2 type transport system ATP-binding protein
MRILIRRLADEGMTVLLSSHLLAEVEELCNRVSVMRAGRIVYEGTIAGMARGTGVMYRLATTDDARARAICAAQRGIGEVTIAHGKLTFASDEAAVAELSRALIEGGVLIQELAPQTVNLEDLFFSLTEGDGVVAEAPAPPVPAAEGAPS